MSPLLAAVMSLFLMASEAESDTETYSAAHKAILESGKPMVVMVGTDWCPPCQAMKRHVLPELRKRRCFRKIAFARVNSEVQGPLAKRLTGGGPIPQLVMFRKTQDGWVRRKLVGRQSVETVERFIEYGIAQDEAAKRQPAIPLAAKPVSLPEEAQEAE